MAGMKALLLSTLISSGGVTERPPGVDQEHIWFTGPASHAECDRAAKESHFGQYTEYGADKVSVLKVGNYGTVKRITQCVKYN